VIAKEIKKREHVHPSIRREVCATIKSIIGVLQSSEKEKKQAMIKKDILIHFFR